MKTILFLFLLAAMAAMNDLEIACIGLAIAGFVILVGDILAKRDMRVEYRGALPDDCRPSECTQENN